MKIKYKKSKFIPIQITLESEEEIEVMYAVLDNNGNIRDCFDRRGIEKGIELKDNMWDKFDKLINGRL